MLPDDISTAEVQRLATFMREPWFYTVRRIETIDLITDQLYEIAVTLDLAVAALPDTEQTEAEVIVPLGLYGKARLPDLSVRNSNGLLLSVLDRRHRAHLVTEVILAGRRERFLDSVDPDGRSAARLYWAFIEDLLTEVLLDEPAAARARILTTRAELHRVLSRDDLSEFGNLTEKLGSVLDDTQLWSIDIAGFADVTPLFAVMRATPGESQVLSVRYRDNFDYADRLAEPADDGRKVLPRVRRLLQYLGLTSQAIYREVANANQARSLWVVVNMPEGIEAVRFFWNDPGGAASFADSTSRAVKTDSAVFGSYRDDFDGQPPTQMIVDMQLKPSASIVTASALTALIFVVATVVFKRSMASSAAMASNPVISLAGLLAAIPATLTGTLAYRNQAFSRRMSRGPRKLLVIVAAQAALLAVVVSLKGRGQFLEWEAYALLVTGLFVTLELALVQWGPRWRKTYRSRIKRRTQPASYQQCRRIQRRDMFYLFITVLAATGLVAFLQLRLKNDHLLTWRIGRDVLQALGV